MITINSLPSERRSLAILWQIWATMRIEIMMQWRRWGFWIAFACVFSLCLWLFLQNVQGSLDLMLKSKVSGTLIAHDFTDAITSYCTLTFGVVVTLLVADRLERDQRLGMTALQHTTPQGNGVYLLGKFLGNYMAVLIPVLCSFLLYALLLIILGIPGILLLALLQSFVLVCLPSYAALLGITLLFASLFPLRIVQIALSMFWLYANIDPPGLPSLNETIFNFNGGYVLPALFPGLGNRLSTVIFPSIALAQQNIAVLLLTALVTLILTYTSLKLQQLRKEGRLYARI